MFLENLTKLEKNLWNSHVEFMGVDHDMAEMYAEDRNDVIEVKDRFNRGHMGSLRTFIDRRQAIKWVGDPTSQTAASDAYSVQIASYEQRPHRSGQYLLYMLRVEKDGKIWMVGLISEEIRR